MPYTGVELRWNQYCFIQFNGSLMSFLIYKPNWEFYISLEIRLEIFLAQGPTWKFSNNLLANWIIKPFLLFRLVYIIIDASFLLSKWMHYIRQKKRIRKWERGKATTRKGLFPDGFLPTIIDSLSNFEYWKSQELLTDSPSVMLRMVNPSVLLAGIGKFLAREVTDGLVRRKSGFTYRRIHPSISMFFELPTDKVVDNFQGCWYVSINLPPRTLLPLTFFFSFSLLPLYFTVSVTVAPPPPSFSGLREHQHHRRSSFLTTNHHLCSILFLFIFLLLLSPPHASHTTASHHQNHHSFLPLLLPLTRTTTVSSHYYRHSLRSLHYEVNIFF